MPSAPLLIGYQGSERPLLTAAAALKQGFQGISFDLRLKPFGTSRSNSERTFRYPRLQDVLENYGDRMFLDIELTSKGMEAEILDVLRQRGPRQDFVVSSAIPEVVM